MASNAQDKVVAGDPKVLLTDASIGMEAVETQDGEAQRNPFSELRTSLRRALRSWSAGRKAWLRAQAWMVAHRSVRTQTSSGTPPTQAD